MKKQLTVLAAIVTLTAALGAGQTAPPTAGRAAAHPDLSGTWLFSIDLPPLAIKRQANGATTVKGVDASGRRAATAVPGALPSTPEPSYKPELRAKVKDLFDHESKTDAVFYCGKPGVPRIGPPRRIVQLPNEVIFLYEDISGIRIESFRPTDVRISKDPEPVLLRPFGRPLGRQHAGRRGGWVRRRNMVRRGGYFHSDAMRVTERFWRTGENLAYQVDGRRPQSPHRAVDDAGASDQAVYRAARGVAALRRAGRQVSAERRYHGQR